MSEVKIGVNKLTIKTRETLKLKRDSIVKRYFCTRVVSFDIFLNVNEKLIFKEKDDNIQVIFELSSIMQYFIYLYLRKKNNNCLIDDRYKINRVLPGVNVDICFTIYNEKPDPCLKLTYTNKNNNDSGFFYLGYMDVVVIDAFLSKIVTSCVLDHSPEFDKSEWDR